MAHEGSISPWLKWLIAVLFLAGGSFFTASIFFSPKIETLGLVTKSRISGGKAKSYHLTLASEPNHEIEVGGEVYNVVRANDTVRLVYRAWDVKATRVEIVSERQRGWVWKEGIIDIALGPLLLLLGFGVLWAAAFGLGNKWYLYFVDAESQEKDK
jgi:hypothetical protein